MISESLVVWKKAPARSRRVAQVAEVHQVAVVRDRDETLGGVDANGLRVEQSGIAGGGVAGVADGHVAIELGEHVVSKDVGDEAHTLDVLQVGSVGYGDAGRLLPAVLQGVQAHVDLTGRLGMTTDGDDSAFFMQLVVTGSR